MSSLTLHELIDSMSPDKALQQMAVEIKRLFSHMREDARIGFLVSLMGDTSRSRETSLVHL
jgi:hypothetical protein